MLSLLFFDQICRPIIRLIPDILLYNTITDAGILIYWHSVQVWIKSPLLAIDGYFSFLVSHQLPKTGSPPLHALLPISLISSICQQVSITKLCCERRQVMNQLVTRQTFWYQFKFYCMHFAIFFTQNQICGSGKFYPFTWSGQNGILIRLGLIGNKSAYLFV